MLHVPLKTPFPGVTMMTALLCYAQLEVVGVGARTWWGEGGVEGSGAGPGGAGSCRAGAGSSCAGHLWDQGGEPDEGWWDEEEDGEGNDVGVSLHSSWVLFGSNHVLVEGQFTSFGGVGLCKGQLDHIVEVRLNFEGQFASLVGHIGSFIWGQDAS